MLTFAVAHGRDSLPGQRIEAASGRQVLPVAASTTITGSRHDAGSMPVLAAIRPMSLRETHSRPVHESTAHEREAVEVAARIRRPVPTGRPADRVGAGQNRERQQPVRQTPAPDSRLVSGRKLTRGERDTFEPALGRDFSAVRVHEGPVAAESAASYQARAFTYGNHIVLGRRAQESDGAAKASVAHELVHVGQQATFIATTPASDHRGRGLPSLPVRAASLSVQRQEDDLIPPELRALGRGFGMGWRLDDEGTSFARELMRWRVYGRGRAFVTRPIDRDWNGFMSARPEIQRALLLALAANAPIWAAAGATRTPLTMQHARHDRSFSFQVTGVELTELESMRLTLHGCHRIEVRGRYLVRDDNGMRTVLVHPTLVWVDRADLHPGTPTHLDDETSVDDSVFTAAGFDYDIRIEFEPGSSVWEVSRGGATRIRGWPPLTGEARGGDRG